MDFFLFMAAGEKREESVEEEPNNEKRLMKGHRKSVLAPKKGSKVIAPKKRSLVEQKKLTKVSKDFTSTLVRSHHRNLPIRVFTKLLVHCQPEVLLPYFVGP